MKSCEVVRTCAVLAWAVALLADAQDSLTNGLTAYYLFNGNANDTVGTNNGAVYGAALTADRFGREASAYSFAGNPFSFISIPSDAGLPTGAEARTISLWVNPASIDYGARLLSQGAWLSSEASDIAFGGPAPGNTQLGFLSQRLNSYGGPGSVLATGAWSHVAITYASLQMVFYVNGQQVAVQTNSLNTQGAGAWRIGGELPDRPSAGYYNGLLDDLRVYNRGLSGSEVLELYHHEAGAGLHLALPLTLSFSSLWVGTNYQLQTSGDLETWTNCGDQLTATNTTLVYPGSWDVQKSSQLFFRLQVVLPPLTPREVCIDNLRQLKAAIQEFALEHSECMSCPVQLSDCTPYLKGSLVCPSGGTSISDSYAVTDCQTMPFCISANGKAVNGHELPPSEWNFPPY